MDDLVQSRGNLRVQHLEVWKVNLFHLLTVRISAHPKNHAYGLGAPQRPTRPYEAHHKGDHLSIRLWAFAAARTSASLRRTPALPADTFSVPTITEGYARTRRCWWRQPSPYVGLTVH